MAKKSEGTKTSKGEHCQKRNPVLKQLRREYHGSSNEACNKLTAFYRGRNVVLTIANPNTNETNKRFIRVNARDVWTGGGKSNNKK